MNIRRSGQAAAKIYHSLYFPPTVIFVAVMVATLFTWRGARVSLTQDLQSVINARTLANEHSIERNLAAYEEILRGGVGLFDGSDEVTRNDWINYLNAFEPKRNYPNVQGIGFARLLTPDDVPAMAAYMQSQGVDNYQVKPAEPARNIYAAVMYIQSVASQSPPTYGFDMYSEPTRRAALLEAQAADTTTITGQIDIGGQPDDQPQAGFNMYVPYYERGAALDTTARRAAAIRGYVFATFRNSIFFKNIEGATNSKTIGYQITVSGGKSGAFYQSSSYASVSKKPHAISETRPLRLYGQTWNIKYVFDRGGLVSEAQLRRPPSVLFGGTFIAALIAMVVLLLLRARAHELAAQKEHAVELAKDELLSLASHQLRTPATGVKQYVGMVLQGFAGRVPKEQKALLEKAYASNDRQLQIINEILHLAKIDSGRIVLARQRTDLNELISDIVNEQRPDLDTANHHLTLQLPKRRILLNVDAHMLRMAIENILSNAIKYTPPGGHITVKLYRNSHHAFIQITDTGIGIAPQDQNELFKQFTRLSNAMSQQIGGTGIGLYLAKHLVELHGGWITVESSLGEGSIFTIILPLRGSEL